MAWFVRRASSSQQYDGATSLVASTLGRNVLEATFVPATTRVGLRSQVVGRRSATEIQKLHNLTLLHDQWKKHLLHGMWVRWLVNRM